MIKFKRWFKWLVAPTLIFLVLAWYFKEPLRLAAWDPDVRVLAQVEISEDESQIAFKGIRDWTYARDEVLTEDYFSETYQVDDLEKVWFYLQPLDVSGFVAHTFVVFEFNESYGDRRHLGISVETRRQQGQEYSVVKGAFKGFMLVHTWATEADLTSRRTDYYDYELFKHELILSKADKKGLLKAFARETNSLHSNPAFYNTVTNNCTNALAYYVNELKPGAIPWHYSFIFTGKSVEYLRSLGYIK
jgi:hypothetical protein